MSTADSPAVERSLAQDLSDLYLAPQQAFASLLVKSRFWLPLAAWIALSILLMSVWMYKMDVLEFIRIQAEAAGKPFQAPPEAALGLVRGMMWGMGLIMPPVIALVAGAVYLLVFRVFMGTTVSFRQCLTVVAWSFLCVGLVSTPLTLGTMALRGEWNLPPQQVLETSAALLLDRSTAAKPLYALASGLDLFSLWTLFLLTTGFAAATKRSLGTVTLGVLGPWVLVLLWSVGWAALLG
jgi:hypothetical protein